jgi:hypothetical protein
VVPDVPAAPAAISPATRPVLEIRVLDTPPDDPK